MAKIDHSLFSADQHALEEVYGLCPECNGQLVLKHANKSSFLACQNYPSCKHTQQLHKNDVSVLKIMAGSECPQCKQELAVKKGRYGMFIGCTGFPDCHYIATKDQSEKNKEDEPNIACPKCKTGKFVKRQNKFGKHFFACDNYPKCKYMLNSPPVDTACQACAWPVVIHIDPKSPDKGLICPQVNCQHKQTL